MNVGRAAFETLAVLANQIDRSLEGSRDTHGRCPVLAAYVHFAFRLPGTERGELQGVLEARMPGFCPSVGGDWGLVG